MPKNCITIVYRDVTPAEAVKLGEHPKARASSWSDLMEERDRIDRNRDMWKDQCAAQAATLATVTPLVQQMLTLKVQFEQDLIATVTNGTPTNRLIAEQYDNAAARLSAFLSGATKESTDHG